jgi:RNA-binding protein
MGLNQRQIKYLKGLAHHLNPVVSVGKNGLSEAVAKEVDQTLNSHELIKVRIACDDRESLRETANNLSEISSSELVQVIGHIAVLYRTADKPAINLPH